MQILERNVFVYKHMCEQVQRSHKLRLPKDDLDVFAYTRKICAVIWVKLTGIHLRTRIWIRDCD